MPSNTTCSECSECFDSRASLLQHYIDTFSGRLLCPHGCRKSKFCSSQLLEQHIREVHPPTQVACPHCGRNFGSELDLQNHSYRDPCMPIRTNNQITTNTVNILSTRLGQRSSASQVSASPISASPNLSLTCNGCRRTFKKARLVSIHRNGAPNTADRFACNAPGCFFASCSASGLQSHRQSLRHFPPINAEARESRPDAPSSHQGSLTRCDLCSLVLWSTNLKQHVADQHPTFKCLDCNGSFGSRNELETHHTSGALLREVIEIECPCGDSFPNRLALVRHVHENREHPEHFRFCFHCQLSFDSVSDYLCHNEKLHDTLYPPDFLSESANSKPGCDSSSKRATPGRAKAGKRKLDTNESKVMVALTCIICLSFPEKLTATGCGHLYCNECIISCLKSKPECPVCRSKTTLAELRQILYK